VLYLNRLDAALQHEGKGNMIRHAVSAISALALLAVPVAAQAAAQPAPRTGAVTEDSQELVGTTAWILAAIGAALVIWGIIELTDDDEPESP
jgi:ABC-type antimicrobial peptide transport system permease subunit